MEIENTEIDIDEVYGSITIQDLQIVYVDDTYARIYGYDSAYELQQQTSSFLDFIAPEHHREAFVNYQKLIEGRMIPRGRTYTNIDRQGRKFTVLAIDHIVQWGGRKAVQVTVLDMSSTIDKVKNLISKKRLVCRKLVTESAQAIMIHRDFKPLLVNASFADAIQAPSINRLLEEDMIVSLLIDEKPRAALLESYQSIMRGEVKGHKVQIPVTTFEGNRRFFNMYCDRVEWEDGPAVRTVLEDVTEKIELREKFRQLMEKDLSGTI